MKQKPRFELLNQFLRGVFNIETSSLESAE